ncbi:protein of unknown function [Amphibacillus marinus]|uniref:DUF1961 family protein n=1 Tax=Amphibacillus marinus TaxID=872970 RepID=A0A1H8H5R2_9BACI|nr:DUF1961 family protein [Amphibacillus marinus]SEN51359.1 protein of unknown function [Amphibacillus marinus]
MECPLFETGDVLYYNRLACEQDLSDFHAEGEVNMQFIDNSLVLASRLNPEQHGDFAHWVLWCKHDFPDRISIEWTFKPLEEPGLCMLFFAAQGQNGEDIFDQSLPRRYGHYPQYHSGAINTYHLSYFRRKWPDERAFCTCNLRKSAGFHLVAQGADPLPTVKDVKESYQLKLIKYEQYIQFSINNLVVLEWLDQGSEFGSMLTTGKLGFRQMAPLKAMYRDLKVSELNQLAVTT